MQTTKLLIIGAGPYGLATAAMAKRRDIDFIIVGEPMEFWRHNMPSGMILRTSVYDNMDPLNTHTLETYASEHGLLIDKNSPISLDLFLDYAKWFQRKKELDVQRAWVIKLSTANGMFEAELINGETISANKVVVSPGLRYFPHIPNELIKNIHENVYSHTVNLTDFEFLRDKRCLIVGGRQSAFEWAALINERTGADIYISHRHDTPKFEQSDWSWVKRLVISSERAPGWFNRISDDEKKTIIEKFWESGRLKLEPWLKPRLNKPNITVMPNTKIALIEQQSEGKIAVNFENRDDIVVDYIVFATGYKVEVAQIPYISNGNIINMLKLDDGYPVLDDFFQGSINGLYFTGVTAVKYHGPMFGFLFGCPSAARIIINKLEEKLTN